MKYDKLESQSNFHWYKFDDGTKIQRSGLSEMIFDLFEDDQRWKIKEIVKEIKMNEETVTHIVRGLCTKEKLQREGHGNKHTIYSKKIGCLLADLYYPKTILDKFNIKDRKVVKAEHGKVISYPLSINHQYTQGSIYFEGGE